MSVVAADDTAGRAQALRAAIDRDYDRLCRCMWGAIVGGMRALRVDQAWDRAWDRAQEVVSVAVVRALERADEYDPRRPAYPWVLRFAQFALLESRRDAQKACYAPIDDDSWPSALARMVDPADDVDDGADVNRHILNKAMASLSERDRQVIELGYFRGLKSDALARAIGAPSPAAARTRQSRAIQTLRSTFLRIRSDAPTGTEGHRP